MSDGTITRLTTLVNISLSTRQHVYLELHFSHIFSADGHLNVFNDIEAQNKAL